MREFFGAVLIAILLSHLDVAPFVLPVFLERLHPTGLGHAAAMLVAGLALAGWFYFWRDVFLADLDWSELPRGRAVRGHGVRPITKLLWRIRRGGERVLAVALVNALCLSIASPTLRYLVPS